MIYSKNTLSLNESIIVMVYSIENLNNRRHSQLFGKEIGFALR